MTPVTDATGTNRPPLLEIDDARVVFYPRRFLGRGTGDAVRAVDGVSLALDRHETLGLVGESGCGKSTLARAVLRLVPLAGGQVRLDGVDLARSSPRENRGTRRRIHAIFQDPYSSLDPRRTVLEIIREPLDIHRLGSSGERRQRVDELLGLVGLADSTALRYPHEFSGGQRQRIGIARALALRPDVIVADEPVTALDVSVQAQITNLLKDLQEELGVAYLYIAHDLAVVRHISQRVAVMYLGRIVEQAPTSHLFGSPSHPYTIGLLSAVPVPDPAVEKNRRRILMRGDLPSPSSPPSGCRFHPRCWLRERLAKPEICERVEPELTTVARDHHVACHFAVEAQDSAESVSVRTSPTRA